MMPKDTIKPISTLNDDEMFTALENAAGIFENADGYFGHIQDPGHMNHAALSEMRSIAQRFKEMSQKLQKFEAANLSDESLDHAIWVNTINRLDGLTK